MTDLVTHEETIFEAWEKQPEESSKAFGAFKVYRDLPPHKRSLRNAVRELFGILTEPKLRQFSRWSSKYGWVWRTSAWDQEQDKVQRDEQIRLIKDSRSRSLKIGQALINEAVKRISKMDADDLQDIDLMIRVLTTGHKLETEALGMLDEETLILEREQVIDNPDYSTMPTEKLRAILIQTRKALPPESQPNVEPDE
jgi:hypothetical protein